MPRMNAITERWVKTLRTGLLDRMLIWNEAHLRHALREYERHYNPQALGAERIDRLTEHRQDRLGGVIHEYRSDA